jgi:hypothetical protein
MYRKYREYKRDETAALHLHENINKFHRRLLRGERLKKKEIEDMFHKSERRFSPRYMQKNLVYLDDNYHLLMDHRELVKNRK